MPSRTRKLRGSRTHGRGKKHGRGAGGRGGTGNAGLHKHKFKWMVKYDPDHFGHHGFVRHAQDTGTGVAINVEAVLAQLPKLEERGFALRGEPAIAVDLAKAGFDRLLGKGRVSVPLRLRVPYASETAVRKVTAAGGSVDLTQAVETNKTRPAGANVRRPDDKP